MDTRSGSTGPISTQAADSALVRMEVCIFSCASSRWAKSLMSCGPVLFLFLGSQEGAVEAVLRLCKTDHLVLRGYCSAILKQFAATPVLREKLVARGGVRLRVFLRSTLYTVLSPPLQ